MTDSFEGARVHSQLAGILTRGKVRAADGEEVPLHSHIPLLECQIIQAWLREYQPQRLLEIGMAYAISTLAICEAIAWHRVRYYHVIDPFQRSAWRSIGLLNLEEAGYANAITWHEATSEEALPKLLHAEMRFDFALIDGSHEEVDVLRDARDVHALLEENGVVVFDDIQLPGVMAGVEYLKTHLGYVQLALPEPFLHSIPVRVRRLNQVPESRVVGLRKLPTATVSEHSC